MNQQKKVAIKLNYQKTSLRKQGIMSCMDVEIVSRQELFTITNIQEVTMLENSMVVIIHLFILNYAQKLMILNTLFVITTKREKA